MTTANAFFCDLVVTTFQHLFGIRMHHGEAQDTKKCRHAQTILKSKVLKVKKNTTCRCTKMERTKKHARRESAMEAEVNTEVKQLYWKPITDPLNPGQFVYITGLPPDCYQIRWSATRTGLVVCLLLRVGREDLSVQCLAVQLCRPCRNDHSPNAPIQASFELINILPLQEQHGRRRLSESARSSMDSGL
jgi:hypothetical protein